MTAPALTASKEADRRRRAQRRAAALALVLWLVGAGAVVATRPAPPTAAGLLMALTAGALWLRRDQGAGRWEAGAAGERATAAALARLGPRWIVVHDVEIPGSRANIDHVAIGPRGCVAVDSKRWRSAVRLGRTLRVGGEQQVELLDRQWWYADVVAGLAGEVVGRPVQAVPLLAVHGAAIRRGLRGRRAVAGVWVGPGPVADRWVRRAGRRLGPRRALSGRERRHIAAALTRR